MDAFLTIEKDFKVSGAAYLDETQKEDVKAIGDKLARNIQDGNAIQAAIRPILALKQSSDPDRC